MEGIKIKSSQHPDRQGVGPDEKQKQKQELAFYFAVVAAGAGPLPLPIIPLISICVAPVGA